MKQQLATLCTVAVFTFCGGAMAAQSGQDHSTHGQPAKTADHSAHGQPAKAAEHKAMAGHNMMSGMIMLGEVTQEGVKAMAHIADVGAAMAKAGRKENFHLMVMFTDAAGKPLPQGAVALRLTAPGSDKPGEPMALVPMGGQFGGDLALTAKGKYRFEVGTKLADGAKRQFVFSHEVK
jgi:hypothetical protein